MIYDRFCIRARLQNLRKNADPHQVPQSGTTVEAPAFSPVTRHVSKIAFRRGKPLYQGTTLVVPFRSKLNRALAPAGRRP